MQNKPFKILGLQQIAIGSENKSKLQHLWFDLLGLKPESYYTNEKENVEEDIVKLGKGLTAVELDLMVPLDASKSPRVQDPALNHIGLWVDDLAACVAYLQQQKVRFTPGGIRKGAAGFDVCFIHPKGNEELPFSGNGVLIELIQAPPEVIDALS